MNRRFMSFCGAALLLATSSANAIFVTRDSAFGANTLVWNESTGEQWLRLDVTRGLSYNAVQESLGTTFAGFQVAERDAVVRLFTGLGIDYWNRPSNLSLPALEDARLTLLQLGGVEQNGGASLGGFADYGGAAYLVDDPDGFSRWTASPFVQGAGASIIGTQAGYYDDAAPMFKPTSYANYGTFLVTAPVPEPETYALMAVGLFATIAHVKRRRKASADA